MHDDFSSSITAVLFSFAAGCQPVVALPITARPDGGGDTSSSSSGGSTTSSWNSVPDDCGNGTPANPAEVLMPVGAIPSEWPGVVLAADATSLYAGTNNALWKVAKTGGTPELISPLGDTVGGIVANATDVYWTDSHGVHSVAGGPTADVFSSMPAGPLALDATSLYWVGGTTIESAPLAGGPPVTLATLTQTWSLSIAVDDTRVYWGGRTEGILAAPLGGGAAVQLAPAMESLPAVLVGTIAVGGGRVYWPGQGAGLGSVPTVGGMVTYQGSDVSAVVVDATSVYWTHNPTMGFTGPNAGSVCKMPLGGGPVTTLAVGLSSPLAIALDDGYVYWADQVSIQRAPK